MKADRTRNAAIWIELNVKLRRESAEIGQIRRTLVRMDELYTNNDA